MNRAWLGSHELCHLGTRHSENKTVKSMHPSPALVGKWQEVTARAVRKEGKMTLNGPPEATGPGARPVPPRARSSWYKQHTRTWAPIHQPGSGSTLS